VLFAQVPLQPGQCGRVPLHFGTRVPWQVGWPPTLSPTRNVWMPRLCKTTCRRGIGRGRASWVTTCQNMRYLRSAGGSRQLPDVRCRTHHDSWMVCAVQPPVTNGVMEGGVQVLCKSAEARNTNHERPHGTVRVPVCGMSLAVWYATPRLGSESKPRHAPAKSETHVEVSWHSWDCLTLMTCAAWSGQSC
jgi:hypothetical protein